METIRHLCHAGRGEKKFDAKSASQICKTAKWHAELPKFPDAVKKTWQGVCALPGTGANKNKLKQLLMSMFFSQDMSLSNSLFRTLSKALS